MLGNHRLEDLDVIRLLNGLFISGEGDIGKSEAEINGRNRFQILLLHLLPHQRVFADHCIGLEGVSCVFASGDVIGALKQLNLVVGLVIVGRIGNQLIMLPFDAVSKDVLYFGVGFQQRKEFDDIRQVVGDAVFADAEQILQSVVLRGRREGIYV